MQRPVSLLLRITSAHFRPVSTQMTECPSLPTYNGWLASQEQNHRNNSRVLPVVTLTLATIPSAELTACSSAPAQNTGMWYSLQQTGYLALWLWPCHFHTWNLTWASYTDNYTCSCWLNPFLVPVLRTPCDVTRDYWDQLPSILDAEPEPKTGLIRAEQISWSAHPHEDSKLSALGSQQKVSPTYSSPHWDTWLLGLQQTICNAQVLGLLLKTPWFMWIFSDISLELYWGWSRNQPPDVKAQHWAVSGFPPCCDQSEHWDPDQLSSSKGKQRWI